MEPVEHSACPHTEKRGECVHQYRPNGKVFDNITAAKLKLLEHYNKN